MFTHVTVTPEENYITDEPVYAVTVMNGTEEVITNHGCSIDHAAELLKQIYASTEEESPPGLSNE